MSYTKLTGRDPYAAVSGLGDTVLNARYKVTTYNPQEKSACYDMLQQKWVSNSVCAPFWDFEKGQAKDTGKGSRFIGGVLSALMPSPPVHRGGQQPQVASSGVPSWVLPVAIGGGAIALILVLKNRRK